MQRCVFYIKFYIRKVLFYILKSQYLSILITDLQLDRSLLQWIIGYLSFFVCFTHCFFMLYWTLNWHQLKVFDILYFRLLHINNSLQVYDAKCGFARWQLSVKEADGPSGGKTAEEKPVGPASVQPSSSQKRESRQLECLTITPAYMTCQARLQQLRGSTLRRAELSLGASFCGSVWSDWFHRCLNHSGDIFLYLVWETC